MEEIKDEWQPQFQILREQESDIEVYLTVKFLNREDIEKYIEPDRVGTTIDDKLLFKEKFVALESIWEDLQNIIERIEGGKEADGDRATFFEIAEDLNKILPAGEKCQIVEPSDGDKELIISMKAILQSLRKKSGLLVRLMTLEQIGENMV